MNIDNPLQPVASVELGDWIADTLGAIIASIVYYKWHCYRRFLEWPTSSQSQRTD